MDSLLASFFSWLGCRDLSNLVFQQRTNCYHSERHQQQYLWRLHQHFMAWVTFTSLLPNVVVDCKQFIINCWLRAMLEKWVCRGWFRETRGRERPLLQPVRSHPYFLNYNGPYLHSSSLGTDGNGATVRTSLFDYSKALHLIDHFILVRTFCNQCKLPPNIIDWITDFLSDRS